MSDPWKYINSASVNPPPVYEYDLMPLNKEACCEFCWEEDATQTVAEELKFGGWTPYKAIGPKCLKKEFGD